ncbi:hypothetical protein Dsin_023862 [Dipteronia sinensis]|uniref:Uncharacterized protein n=1 Tax=Dipteronia sinensis TaxID=43782 RepID=A0AAE0A4Y8_9ROSI|nr:hypothetical protein Dsin_023862 [Dipteronia sinensis]
MRSWTKAYKSSGDQSKRLEGELAAINEKAEELGWTDVLRQERTVCLVKLWKNIRLDEQKWRQVSRVKWVKEGDRNSRFFHLVSNMRRKSNFIGEISISGRSCSGLAQVGEGIFKFFKDHFKNVGWTRPRIADVHLKKISEEESLFLEADFSITEVWPALRDCDDKKLGLFKGLSVDQFDRVFVQNPAKVLANRLKFVMNVGDWADSNDLCEGASDHG